MARTRSVEAPASSDVYFGMVLCSFFAILASVGLLVWELVGTYGFESTPAAIAAPALPKIPPRAVAPGGTATAPVVEPEKPAVALTPAETPAPVAPTAPAVAVTPPPAPAVIPQTVVSPATPATPTATPSGPVPGFALPKRN